MCCFKIQLLITSCGERFKFSAWHVSWGGNKQIRSVSICAANISILLFLMGFPPITRVKKNSPSIKLLVFHLCTLSELICEEVSEHDLVKFSVIIHHPQHAIQTSQGRRKRKSKKKKKPSAEPMFKLKTHQNFIRFILF